MNSIHSSSPLADRLVSLLQAQQHLKPHQTVAQALDRIRQQAGLCPSLCGEALELLQLDASRKIGRLKGCELTQLGRALGRLCQQATTIAPAR